MQLALQANLPLSGQLALVMVRELVCRLRRSQALHFALRSLIGDLPRGDPVLMLRICSVGRHIAECMCAKRASTQLSVCTDGSPAERRESEAFS